MKVKTSPNSKFASISDIRRTQIAAREAINEKDDEEGSIHSDSTSDCIEIEQLFNQNYLNGVRVLKNKRSEWGGVDLFERARQTFGRVGAETGA